MIDYVFKIDRLLIRNLQTLDKFCGFGTMEMMLGYRPNPVVGRQPAIPLLEVLCRFAPGASRSADLPQHLFLLFCGPISWADKMARGASENVAHWQSPEETFGRGRFDSGLTSPRHKSRPQCRVSGESKPPRLRLRAANRATR